MPGGVQVGDDGISHVIAPDKCVEAGCCEDAADECPVDAISWSTEQGDSPGRRLSPTGFRFSPRRA